MFELFCLDPENDFFRAVTEMQYQNFWIRETGKITTFFFFPMDISNAQDKYL